MMRHSIRISVFLWAVLLLAALAYFVVHILAFTQIFFEHAGIPVTQRQAADLYSEDTNKSRQQYIPKIIHQVFHNWHDPGNETMPKDWDEVRKTCTDRNPDFEYRLWTEKASRDFIEAEYPWFLHTYDGYRHKVQRVDAVRYFILLHYGGIYLDLDNGCKANLSPLLYYPMWITDGGRGALSNNILASRPNHPFWARLTHSLIPFDYNYVFPYVTISYASGQWFETAIWEEYHGLLPKPEENPAVEHRLHRLKMDDRPGSDEWVFFTQERGGTWINWDNLMFLWIGDHLFLLLLMVAGAVGGTFWLGSRHIRRKPSGYKPLTSSRSSV